MARDRFHGTVRRALEKDGWLITADPYIVRFDRTAVEIDLAAEQLLAAERTGQKIAVEVKSFLGPSRMYDFHLALGQFLTYRLAIAQHEPARLLYLPNPSMLPPLSRPFSHFFPSIASCLKNHII